MAARRLLANRKHGNKNHKSVLEIYPNILDAIEDIVAKNGFGRVCAQRQPSNDSEHQSENGERHRVGSDSLWVAGERDLCLDIIGAATMPGPQVDNHLGSATPKLGRRKVSAKRQATRSLQLGCPCEERVLSDDAPHSRPDAERNRVDARTRRQSQDENGLWGQHMPRADCRRRSR